jgi:hypothetical protein
MSLPYYYINNWNLSVIAGYSSIHSFLHQWLYSPLLGLASSSVS